jgi:hypothetical protein
MPMMLGRVTLSTAHCPLRSCSGKGPRRRRPCLPPEQAGAEDAGWAVPPRQQAVLLHQPAGTGPDGRTGEHGGSALSIYTKRLENKVDVHI